MDVYSPEDVYEGELWQAAATYVGGSCDRGGAGLPSAHVSLQAARGSRNESLPGFWEVVLGPLWTMFRLLRLLKVGGLRPPTPPGTWGTWGLHPEKLFFNF